MRLSSLPGTDRAIQGPCGKRLMRVHLDGTVKPCHDEFV
jgi:hypothetical protein